MKEYVTYNKFKDMMGIFSDILTHEKDYEVLYKSRNGNNLFIETDYGTYVLVHQSYFDTKPILPESTIEEEDTGFDNLVRSDYKLKNGVDYIDIRNLSEWQFEFLRSNLKIVRECDHKFSRGLLICYGAGFYHSEVDKTLLNPRGAHEVFFNDLFVEKGTVE